jgi:hypothetical protein
MTTPSLPRLFCLPRLEALKLGFFSTRVKSGLIKGWPNLDRKGKVAVA